MKMLLRVQGDGDCFYRSMVQLRCWSMCKKILRPADETAFARELRRRVAEVVLQYPHLSEYALPTTPRQVAAAIRAGRWAEHLEMAICATLLRCTIVAKDPNARQTYRVTGAFRDVYPEKYELRYVTDTHFDPVFRN